MNTALQHVGAKPKDGDGKKKKQKLPKAAALFAKQMGLDLTGLEAEADDIWSMLNNMSEDNPMQYESFVQEQMENKARAEKLEPEGESAKYFRPTAGFCIRTQTTGGDGIKVRERGQGKKLFVNICSHVALEPPRDQSGKPAMDERLSADGLQFPLLIGPTRDCQDSDGADAIAIDVIFHPAVIHHCLLQSQFKSQIVSLALQWVKQDATVEFDEYMWQPLKSPEYMGGRGVDDSTPVLMSVEYAIQQSAGPKERSDTYLSGETVADKLPAGRNQALTDSSLTRSSAALATPQNLLRFSELDKSEQNEIANENIKLSTSAAPAKKPLVQVVCAEGGAPRVEQLDEPEPEILASASAAFGPKQKPQKVIKKGFLNDLSSKGKASNIYPEKGSAEGEGGAKGGTYQRFMSKCQVIDTSKMPKNDGPPAPGAIHKPDSTVAVAKSQPASKPVSVAVTSAEDSKSRLNPTDTAALDTLFSQLDENYKTSYDLSQMTSQEINFTDQLADIAKLIGGGLGDFNVDTAKKAATSQIFTDRPPVIPVNPQGLIRFANCIPSPAKVVVQECFDGGEDGVKISITSLTVDQIKLADLKVSDSEIELSVPANSTGGNLASLVVTANNKASFKFDVNNISAKMSKKKCQIDIFAKSLK